MTGVRSNRQPGTWQGAESRCSSKQQQQQRSGSARELSRRQRNGNRWRTARPRRRCQAQARDGEFPKRNSLVLSLHASLLTCKQHRARLALSYPNLTMLLMRRTKQGTLMHTCSATRSAGLHINSLLTPSLPAHPNARDTSEKKLCFAYETRRHHSTRVLRRRLVRASPPSRQFWKLAITVFTLHSFYSTSSAPN